jgi:hypothetical protein
MHRLSFLFPFHRFLLAHVFGGTGVYLHVLEDVSKRNGREMALLYIYHTYEWEIQDS